MKVHAITLHWTSNNIIVALQIRRRVKRLILSGIKSAMIKSAMACVVMVDGDASSLIYFGKPVAVVYDARVDERSYVDETVNKSVTYFTR